VFDENGAVAEVVSTPAGFESMSVSDSLVAGIHFDEDEVQYVRVYRQSSR